MAAMPIPSSGDGERSDDSTPRCILLELPLEIRITIYEHTLLYPGDCTFSVPHERFWDEDYSYNPALLRTCQQIHREALPVFKRNTIVLDLDLQGDDDEDLYGQGGLWPEWLVDLRTTAYFPYVEYLPGPMVRKGYIDKDVLCSMTGIKVSVDPRKMWATLSHFSPAPIGPLARLLVILADEPHIGGDSQGPLQKKLHLSLHYIEEDDNYGIPRDTSLSLKEEKGLIYGIDQEGILEGLRGLRGIRDIKIDGDLSTANMEKLKALVLEDKTDAKKKQRLLELGGMEREDDE